jgi:hypothetical protein
MTVQRTLPSRDQLASAGSSVSNQMDQPPDGGPLTGRHAHLGLSSLRLLKVPEVAPPFDGEILPGGSSASGPSATSTGAPAAGTAASAAWTGALGRALPVQRQDAAAGARPPAGARLARTAGYDDWTRQFASLLVESLAGARPLRQLLPWMTDRARVQLRRVAPVLRCGQRPRVLRVLASQPTDGVMEMSVIVGLGPRTLALAVRLEETVRAGQPTRWLCTDIETA